MDVVYSYFTRLARQLILVTLVKVYSPYSILDIHLGGFSPRVLAIGHGKQ